MNRLDLMRACLEKGVPFFSYRKPAAEGFVVGLQRSSEVVSVADFKSLDIGGKGFVVAPFLFGEGAPAYFLKADFWVEEEDVPADVQAFLSNAETWEKRCEEPSVAMDRADYLRRVNRLIASVRAGEAGKVVFARSIVSQLPSGFDFAEAFARMEAECRQAFVYCLFIPDVGLWMGATPELLLCKVGRRVATVALAGTMPAGAGPWSAKNSDEQAFVVRYVEQALRSHEVGDLKIEGPVSVSAGAVCHLKTIFSAVLRRDEDAVSLLASLHPTPAVCGYPKMAALRLIAAEETVERSLYAGFVGPVDGGDFSFYVNLRCMRICGVAAELFVGGGIMRDSVAEEEWNETVLKSKTMGDLIY